MKIIIPSTTSQAPAHSKPIACQGNYYLNLLTCLNYPPDKTPVADILKQLHGLEGEWLIASPISWQATHNDVLIMASETSLECQEEEGRAWFSAFTELTSTWGFEAYYHDATTWLVRPNQAQAPTIHAKPVSALTHRSMMPELQQLDKTMYWQRLLTETQLFFSAHTLNRQRSPQCPINGIWFWGGGQFQPSESLILIQDETLLPLAQVLSKHIKPMAKQRYPHDAILLVNQLDEAMLQKISRYSKHEWYWNNQAYQTSTLWCKIFANMLR